MVCFGVCMQILGAYWLSRFTLQVSTLGIIWPLVVQGLGMACLFVPLSTTAISTIPRTQLADATGLYSLARQIGGSFGLAIFATLLGNFQIRAAADIGSHVVATSPVTMSRLMELSRAFMARGMDSLTARATALRLLDLNVSQQGMVIAFDRTFFLGGLTFLAILPLAYFLKVDRSGGAGHGAAEVHLEA